MFARRQLLQVRSGWWLMQKAQRICKSPLQYLMKYFFRKEFAQGMAIQPRQRLLRQLAQARLGETFSGGINRCQMLVQWQGAEVVQRVIFRMIKLETSGAATGFAKYPQPGAVGQTLLLGVGKMIKT